MIGETRLYFPHSESVTRKKIAEELEQIGLPVAHAIFYRYLSSNVFSLESAFLHVFIGGWKSAPESELKQVLALQLDRSFEVCTPLLESLKKRYPDEEEAWNSSVVPHPDKFFLQDFSREPALYYDLGGKIVLYLPDSVAAFEQIWREGLKELLVKKKSFVQRLYTKRFLLEKALDLSVERGRFPSFQFTQEGSAVTATTIAPAGVDQEELFRPLEELSRKSLLPATSETVHAFLKESGRTLILAESCSGGALAEEFTRHAGASNYFVGSVVAYCNDLKKKLLGVPEEILEEKGAVSSECSVAMAKGALQLGGVVAISVTGIAGPEGGSDTKPVGTVWVTLADENGYCKTWNACAVGARCEVIQQIKRSVFQELLLYLTSPK